MPLIAVNIVSYQGYKVISTREDFAMQKYIELTKPDKKKLESDWYHFCSRKQIPFIKITARARLADVHWDYITYNDAKIDETLNSQAEYIKLKAKEIFNSYAHAQSDCHITETVITFYDLVLNEARQAAEDLYDTISSLSTVHLA